MRFLEPLVFSETWCCTEAQAKELGTKASEVFQQFRQVISGMAGCKGKLGITDDNNAGAGSAGGAGDAPNTQDPPGGVKSS